MKCPSCGGDTYVQDSRYYPLDADRGTRGRDRWLDIPAQVRAVMPKGSHWRKRECRNGHVHHTFELSVVPTDMRLQKETA